MTAKEAAEKLKPFGFKVGNDKDGKPIKPSWAAIDTFVKNNPKAKDVIKANKGALVQSERLGFSNGGGIFDKDYADSAILNNWAKLAAGEEDLSKYEGDTKTFKQSSVTNYPNFGDDSNEERDRNRAVKEYRDYLVYQTDEDGNTLQYYGTRGDDDIEASAFTREDVAKNANHPNFKLYSQKLYSRGPTVGFTDPDTGLFRALTFNQAEQAKNAGIVYGSKQ